ncbi:TraR/DksA C4-type zinc finger protein [Desulfoluna spongiiphila]|uniref:TraR/DksA C4-type zinc finger protein n=1 Tax=Desulfoluna spongiiphila TaxID=419481 RepID=UPI00125BD72D|nr:TraR/DksA C4-type zinc finger protein [Desulfoluna spongiiphila]VVS91066.1 zinc finger dksa/trar c4-type [Desulfoluna spongiiphila]
MDILDRAQILESRERNAAVASARAALPTGPGLAICAHCDEPIPEGRRKAMPGCTLCLDCQEELETM